MASDFYSGIYNPDVLSCIANLSNDEVFTPPEVVNHMLDLLPQELFSDPDTKFLDPACKSGVFLREIAKRLLKGLEPVIPNLQSRIDHIFHEQLYGIAITELTSLLSRRSVYCSKYPNGIYSVSKFENPEGNIRFKKTFHQWRDGTCIFCGVSQKEYKRNEELETHAYELIHTTKPEDIFKMKFDVIISNPPYQLSDGGYAASAKPIYQYFVEQAKKLNPKYLTMIIPARWYSGGKGLDDFRIEMLNDDSIRVMVDYPNSQDCFQGVNVAGGICYFLRDRDYHGDCVLTSIVGNNQDTNIRKLNEFDVFIRYNTGVNIIHKILTHHESMMDSVVSSYSVFAIRSFIRGATSPYKGCVKLISSEGNSYIDCASVGKGQNLINKYKTIVTYAMSGGNKPSSDGKYQIFSSLMVLEPNTVTTETYLVLGAFDTKNEAENLKTYMSTKFARFLVFLTLSSIHITKTNFQFVPIQDFSKPWTDEELYAKYDLSNDEIDFIESIIKPMNLEGED